MDHIGNSLEKGVGLSVLSKRALMSKRGERVNTIVEFQPRQGLRGYSSWAWFSREPKFPNQSTIAWEV